MFRKRREWIRAPEADRRELQWLKEQLEPEPTHPELMEVDDNWQNFTINRNQIAGMNDGSSQEGSEDEDQFEALQPVRKITKRN